MRGAIEEAIQHWEEQTCITFEYMSQDDILKTRYGKKHKYVLFKNGNGYVSKGLHSPCIAQCQCQSCLFVCLFYFLKGTRVNVAGHGKI